MTAGACAGFAAATGAPVSGILFAIEEAHHKISPLLVTVSFVAVSVCTVTVKLLTPLLGVSPSLFRHSTELRWGLKIYGYLFA